LRWEFGFTCAFCLLHESDLAGKGAEGLGLTTIEHFVPARTEPWRINQYDNCFYACRLCNRARSGRPVIDSTGRSLLDPCRHRWADHFRITDDGWLLAREEDGDAAYTEWAYDLNDLRKVELRQWRATTIREHLELIAEAPDLEERLLAESAGGLGGLRTIQRLREGARIARAFMKQYMAIPRDADPACRCGRNDHHTLPSWLEEQTSLLPS
jgi:hypothetical protein